MLLFRSEDHIEAWSTQRGIPRGESLTVSQCWDLARRWFSNRLDADWRRRTPDEAHAVFASVGLTGPFWQLTEH